jgi:hypothetical protein
MHFRLAGQLLWVLEKQPLLASSVTGFVTAAAGDIYCQMMVERSPLNLRRTAEMGGIRAVIVAPLLHFYFPWLFHFFPGKSYIQVLKRVAADQCFGSPLNIAIVFISSGILRGQSHDFIRQRIHNQWFPTWQRGLTFWPFVHILNFRFVPLHNQPIVSHLASVYWQVVLSNRTNMQLDPPK